jgi:hypothetical protein
MNAYTTELKAVEQVAATDETFEILALSLDDLDLVGSLTWWESDVTNSRGAEPSRVARIALVCGTQIVEQFDFLHFRNSTAPTGAAFFLPHASPKRTIRSTAPTVSGR